MTELKKLHVNNIDISYEEAGEGRPMVLIHGNGEIIRFLTGRFRFWRKNSPAIFRIRGDTERVTGSESFITGTWRRIWCSFWRS